MELKLCRNCKTKKPLEDFNRRNNNKYIISYCKPCVILRVEKWRKKNRKRFLVYQAKAHRERYWKNPEKYRAKQRAYYAKKRNLK